jgi:hypothetical protein
MTVRRSPMPSGGERGTRSIDRARLGARSVGKNPTDKCPRGDTLHTHTVVRRELVDRKLRQR